MSSSRLRNHFRFALHKEPLSTRETIPLNKIEKVGNLFSWFAYDFRLMLRSSLYDPRVMTIIFTVFFMSLTSLLFYPTSTFIVLCEIFSWIVDNIEWKYVRFALWLISEITILGLGIRAFGRFTNSALMKFHGIG